MSKILNIGEDGYIDLYKENQSLEKENRELKKIIEQLDLEIFELEKLIQIQEEA